MEAKIKPQDLKLNNLVMYNYKGNDEVCIVDSIREGAIECRFINGMREDMTTGIITAPEHLIGVPLSEDWLRRMGFEESKYFFTIKLHTTTYLEVAKNPTKDFKDCSIVREGEGLWFRSVFYVHQLQNLSCSLTGSELTITDINNI